MKKTNIVLIGMPGSGKSTLGKRLADTLGKTFIDTDKLLEQHENMHIQSILDRKGLAHFRSVEEHVLSELTVQNSVISTGGSAVYSSKAMRHLAKEGLCVYLRITLETLLKRVDNQGSRGLAVPEGYSLEQLYKEREDLYQNAAEVIFDNDACMEQVDYPQLLTLLASHEE